MTVDTRIRSLATTIAPLIMLLTLQGCNKSTSFYEGLAKTPHLAIQDSHHYASMNPNQQDFLYLTEAVREAHPAPYGARSKELFDAEQQRLLESLGSDTSRAALEQSLDSFLSKVRDSHTNAQTSWRANQLQYPVSFFWVRDTLYLASVAGRQDSTLLGSRVLALNGIPTQEILTRFMRFVAYDNLYDARRVLQWYFVFPAFHREAAIITTDTLELSLLGRDRIAHRYRILPVLEPKRFFHYQSHPITEKGKLPFTFTILKGQRACYLQWNAMMDRGASSLLSFPTNVITHVRLWWMGVGYFDDFLQSMFAKMRHDSVTTLIVDLRGNGGGRSRYGHQLLQYLGTPSSIRNYSTAVKFSSLYRAFFPDDYREYATQYLRFAGKQLPDSLILTSDFVKEDSSEADKVAESADIESKAGTFKGRVYFLIGDGTYSSAIIFATLIKDNKLFTIVGQPTRGRPSHFGEMLVVKLPNSGVLCTISCKKFLRPDVKRDSEESLYPDVEIWPSYDDRFNGRDPVLDWVLQDANKVSG